MTLIDWLIVGSGPSGCAAAAALIERGERPVVVDGGHVSTPTASPGSEHSQNEPGRKSWFGSEQAYAQTSPPQLLYARSVLARASYGVGGFSRVWGATAELQDWADWPEDCRPSLQDEERLWELLPRAVTSWPDEQSPGANAIPGSPSSRRVMQRLRYSKATQRWIIQPSAVAIETRPSAPGHCVPCGQCLTGCPRDAIWYSGSVIQSWAARGLVDHRPGVIVERLNEARGVVRVAVRDPRGVRKTLMARHVLVAAGALASAGIAIASGYRQSLYLKDTATAFGGIITAHRASGLDCLAHGLSQWWISDSDHRFLAQVYAPSLENSTRLAVRVPRLLRHLKVLELAALHIHPVVAYLNETESGGLVVKRSGQKIVVNVHDGGASRSMDRWLRALSRTLRRRGLLMPVGTFEITPPGTGYHSGASLPHGVETDSLGRVAGSRRVHFVDSSVIPTISVGSITPTVMINALRITRQASEAGT